MTPDGLATHRQAYLEAIRAYNAEGKPARSWPIQFLIRRTGHHVMDHAWEMEDRDLDRLNLAPTDPLRDREDGPGRVLWGE